MASKIQIILLKNYPKLGNKGTITEVSQPLFENVLKPQGIAKLADTGTIKAFNEKVAKEKKDKEHAHAALEGIIGKLKDGIEIRAKATPSKNLYAKLSHADIAQAIFDLHHVRIPKEKITCERIEHLGTYEYTLDLNGKKSKLPITIRETI